MPRLLEIKQVWGDWPESWLSDDEKSINVRGWSEPPGGWTWQAFIFCALTAGAHLYFVGSPGAALNGALNMSRGFTAGNEYLFGAAVIFLIATPAYFYLWRPLWIWLLGSQIDVHVDEDEVVVKRRFKTAKFSRTFPRPQIGIEEHPWATQYQIDRKATAHRRPYFTAIQVVIRVGEHRHVVTTMKGTDNEMAGALVRRLQATVYKFEGVLGIATQGKNAPQLIEAEMR